MRFEISSAAGFLMNLLRMGNTLDEQQLEVFRGHLEEQLRKHYQHHWFPEQPCKGSGYRCIRINHKMDPVVAKAARAIGVSDSSLLHNMFPNELTLWIDPREVSYRIGENGSICVLYDGAMANSNHHNNTHNNYNHRSSSTSTNVQAKAQEAPSGQQPNLSRYSTCKEIVNNIIMDPRNMNFEQFATFVSS